MVQGPLLSNLLNTLYYFMSRASAFLAPFSRHAKTPKPVPVFLTELIVTVLSFSGFADLLRDVTVQPPTDDLTNG